MQQDQDLLDSLDELAKALRENTARNQHIIKRAQKLRRMRAKGIPWSELVSEDQRPLIVELLSQNLQTLSTAGSRLRRLEAQALHDEGLSMERIAKLFGVSRQRVSELLRSNMRSNGGSRG